MIARCGIETPLTDAEIAAIVRGAAMHGQASPFDAIDVLAECVLDDRHDGPCAGNQANLTGKPGMAWLRWEGDDRRVDWLADCTQKACLLFRGHAGNCYTGPGSA